MDKNSNWRPVALSLTVLGAVARLVPHPPNFAPVGAMSMFAGARLPGWQAYLMPLVLMAITDPILAGVYGVPAYSPFQLVSYASFLISVWIGRRLRASESVSRIVVATLLNSVQFFVFTNFASWLWFKDYSHNASGLVACYIAALPFFRWTLFGDLFYVGLFFGLHAWLSRKVFSSERVALAA
jgi:hypothetical protein